MPGSVSRQNKVNVLIGTRISHFVPAKAKFFSVIFWPYNKFFIDQACSNNAYIHVFCTDRFFYIETTTGSYDSKLRLPAICPVIIDHHPWLCILGDSFREVQQ